MTTDGAGVAERDVILDELHRALHGDPWHGNSLMATLAGVSADHAAARPVANAHSIGELVLHLGVWTGEVARRLADRVARDPDDGDFPSFAGGEQAWAAAREPLLDAHARLEDAVRAFPPANLHEICGESRDRPLGSGVSFGVMLHGVAQHYAYHTGQIAILKKMLG
ncbi:MAG TPA: DinB family protein [Longimicrobium sp.]|uniref:DinB family protein n=1 Tax=Longimicrobium sp. TaxID=2029185 RepID=UPI002EDB72E9